MTQPGAFLRSAYGDLAVTEDGVQDIVEIVRDAASQRAHRFEPLGAPQLLLQLAQFPLGLPSLGDVEHEADRTHGFAVVAEERTPLLVQPAHLAVRVHDAVFDVDLDRKSTRLNSSHDQISYAVFCLKKKKKTKKHKQKKKKKTKKKKNKKKKKTK